jgi:hypothetical protein
MAFELIRLGASTRACAEGFFAGEATQFAFLQMKKWDGVLIHPPGNQL